MPDHPSQRIGASDPAIHAATVLFVCVHNAGRSQMAAGFLKHLAGDRIEVLSAGSLPADEINPVAVEAMAEKGIDISKQRPKRLADSAVRRADVVITMGCGDACPFYPGKRYEDWQLPDPAGLDVGRTRPIRDAIEERVRGLLPELLRGPGAWLGAPGDQSPTPRDPGGAPEPRRRPSDP